jgi:hypothetical protein
MTIHVFGNKFRAKAPAPAGAPPTGAAPGVDPTALANAQREVQIANAKAAQAVREAEELRRKAQEADAERERSMVRTAVTNAAAKARALNPDHVVALRAADFIVHNGKVVSKADPARDVDVCLAEFFGGDGKYLLAPAVPGGGSGAPATQVVQQSQPADLSTNEGLTRLTRQLTHAMFSPPTKAAAPAAQGAPAGTKPAGT